MKKFFSLIALVGVIAACTPEQVETAFKLAGAKVTVNVEVRDIINGGNYTGAYTVSSTFGTVSGNTITYQAGDSEAVPTGDYTVSVSGPALAKTYSSNFTVPSVLAGGEATITVVVPVGEPINGWTVDCVFDEESMTTGENVYTMAVAHNAYPTHAYSHNGLDNWYYNNTEFAVDGVCSYNYIYRVSEVSNIVDNKILGFEDEVAYYVDGYSFDISFDDEYEFTVGAYSMWNVVLCDAWIKAPATVFAFKDANENEEFDKGEEYLELGSFDVKQTRYFKIEKIEIAYPGAPGHAHWHEGHGHNAHGSMPNAGGGISYNE